MEQRSLFGLSEHLERISKVGDPLEVLEATVDFEYFRGWLLESLGYGAGAKGGRPPFAPGNAGKLKGARHGQASVLVIRMRATAAAYQAP